MTVPPKLQLQQLVDLQKMDDEISECRKILHDIPRQLDSARAELEEKKIILKVVMDEIETLQKERKNLEQEVQSENDHMAKAKIKLPAVKTNKEYTAILTEVDAIKEKVSKIEDKELEVMEVLEIKSRKFLLLKKNARKKMSISMHIDRKKKQKKKELSKSLKA